MKCNAMRRSYDDFWDNFKQIDICDRSTGFGDLALDIDEAKGFCGPLCGCTYGCFKVSRAGVVVRFTLWLVIIARSRSGRGGGGLSR
jgi:hypothetical protein